MQHTPGTMELADKAGISKSYASEILSGAKALDDPKSRKPSRPLAIHIMRTTGWRHPILSELTDDQIATLETIEPWKSQAAA